MGARAWHRRRRQVRGVTSVPVKAPIEELPTIHAVTNDEIMLRPGFLRKAMGIMRVLGVFRPAGSPAAEGRNFPHP